MAHDVRPLLEITGNMKSPNHTVLVMPFLYGQFRIQLTRLDWPDPHAPAGHGGIVRELCTYHAGRALMTALRLTVADDPEAFCRELAQPWNCESPNGRIRLDNEPPPDVNDRSYTCTYCGAVSHNPNDAREQYCGRCKRFADIG